MPVLRRWIQIVATALSNACWMFPHTKGIYQGTLKSMCVPGLNCYSCPAATGACPLGSLQGMIAGLRPAVKAGNYHFGAYIIGTLGLTGSLVGRMPCGWVCPFGLLQELIFKSPSRKFKIPQFLTHFKYLFLALFIFILHGLVVDDYGYGMMWFCRFICPAGTLEAGIPMLILKPELREIVGILFYSKLTILIIFIMWMVISSRPFCRVVCPLGAIYSLFNKHSVFKMIHDPDKCTHCQECYNNCPMGIKFYEGPNQYDCIRCLKCLNESCRFGAISYEFAGMPVIKPVEKNLTG